MNVVFKIGGVDFSEKLSTYTVSKERSAQKTVTTLSMQELSFGVSSRTILTFSFWPLTEEEDAKLYSAITGTPEVEYTDPYFGGTSTEVFRCLEPIDATFSLLSVDGKRRYSGGEIILRGVTASA